MRCAPSAGNGVEIKCDSLAPPSRTAPVISISYHHSDEIKPEKFENLNIK